MGLLAAVLILAGCSGNETENAVADGSGEDCAVCHNDTTLGWFRGNGDDTRTLEEIETTRANALKRTGGTAETIHWDMIRLAFSSPSTIAIAPMQDFLGLGSTARLNRPGTTLDNWRWRMQSKDLDPELMASVAQLVQVTSRVPEKRLDSAA